MFCVRANCSSTLVARQCLSYSGLRQNIVNQSLYLSTEASQVPAVPTAEYPPIKQKFPPGSWGTMSEYMAWQWHKRMQAHHELPTLEERLAAFCTLRRTWVFKSFTSEPHMLDYQQYVTKTKLIDGIPELYSRISVDDKLDRGTSLVADALTAGLCHADVSRRYQTIAEDKRPTCLTRDVMGDVIGTLVTYLSGERDYLARSQYDEDVRVEAVWDRFGFPAKIPYVKDIKWEPIKRRETFRDSRFQGTHTADILLRTERPLPPVLPLEDSLCQTCTYPDFHYWPTVLGQPRAWQKGSVVPGFWLGNPCEFGQLSVILTNQHRWVMKEFDDDVIDEMELGAGMVAGFTWLVAQAHYQGFSSFADLTRPFCTQTIVTDGHMMRFLVSQLNTLALWKGNDGNPAQNLCWYSPKLPLYDCIESGEVVGVNSDAVLLLLQFLLNKPGEMRAETPLPGGYVRPRDVVNLIDPKEEEVIEEEEELLYD